VAEKTAQWIRKHKIGGEETITRRRQEWAERHFVYRTAWCHTRLETTSQEKSLPERGKDNCGLCMKKEKSKGPTPSSRFARTGGGGRGRKEGGSKKRVSNRPE